MMIGVVKNQTSPKLPCRRRGLCEISLFSAVFIIIFSTTNCSPNRRTTTGMIKTLPDSPLLDSIMKSHPSLFDSVIRKKNELRLQVIYTQIDRDENGHSHFTDHFFHSTGDYFYPAST